MDEINKGMLLILISLLGIIPFVSCEDNVLSILRASREALATHDTEKNMEVVNDYYFTPVKEKSIWYHALKDGRENLGAELGMENLIFIEKLIQRVASHYQTCLKAENCLAKVNCFSHLYTSVADLQSGAKWPTSTSEVSKENKAKYGTLYLSVGTLISHLSVIATNSFKCYTSGVATVSSDKIKSFLKVLRKIQMVTHEYVNDVVTHRLDQISPVIICEITERFWKLYEKNCETRWHTTERSDDEQQSVTNINLTHHYGSTDKYKEFDRVSILGDYLNREESSLDAVEELGGIHGLQNIKFRAQVHDYIDKDVLFEGFIEGESTARGDLMDILAARALRERSKVEKIVRREVLEFAAKTFTISNRALEKAIKYLQLSSTLRLLSS